MVDVGNGETIPEVIFTYEKNTEGKILRKKKRLVKKQKKGLSDVQKQEIDGAFKLFDKDGSGNIDFYELRDAMRALGIQLTKDQVKVMMSEIDQDNNGFIDQDEFRLLTLQVIGEAVLSLPPDECDAVFPELYLPVMEEANLRALRPWRVRARRTSLRRK